MMEEKMVALRKQPGIPSFPGDCHASVNAGSQ